MKARIWAAAIAVAVGIAAIAVVAAVWRWHPEDRVVAAPADASRARDAMQPDPLVAVDDAIKRVAVDLASWLRAHPGARCRDLVASSQPRLDPWGHAFRITCTEQPGDQIAGVISAGPDGRFDTPDDVTSWQLDRDVTDLLRIDHQSVFK